MRWIASCAMLMGISAVCSASPTFISGFDFDTGATQVLGPNAATAQGTFVASLGLLSATLNLDALPIGFGTTDLGSGVTVTCSNCDSMTQYFGQSLSGIASVGSTEFGYNTTGATTTSSNAGQFYRVAGNFNADPALQTSVFTLSFASPVSAFGAYVVGIEPFLGSTTVTFLEDGVTPITFIPNPLPNTNSTSTLGHAAGIQFIGILDLGHTINQITFTTTNPVANTRDVWAIDDMLLGQAVPEPAALGLTGLGLIAFALIRRRRSL